MIALDRGRLAGQSAEHLAILDRIEAGDRAGAAGLLVRHLDAGRASKAGLLEGAGPLAAALGSAPKAQDAGGLFRGKTSARPLPDDRMVL